MISGLTTYHDKVSPISQPLSAYHYYVMSHTAAFAIVTQSMAMLVTFDIMHTSIMLHTIRIVIYTSTIVTFYYAVWYSYNLTGSEGYRSTCPAYCKFKTYSPTWILLVVLGAPVYLCIIIDYLRRLNMHRLKFYKIEIHEYNDSRKGWHKMWQIFTRYGRFTAWIISVCDLSIGLTTFITSWRIKCYSGLIATEDFDENSWGFGQIVAMILIILPFLTAFEEFKGRLNYHPLITLSLLTCIQIKLQKRTKKRSHLLVMMKIITKCSRRPQKQQQAR